MHNNHELQCAVCWTRGTFGWKYRGMTSPVDICSTCSTSLASGQRRCGLWLPVRCELVPTVYCGGSTAFRQAARSPDCPNCLYGRAAALCNRRVRPAVRACVCVCCSWVHRGTAWRSCVWSVAINLCCCCTPTLTSSLSTSPRRLT